MSSISERVISTIRDYSKKRKEKKALSLIAKERAAISILEKRLAELEGRNKESKDLEKHFRELGIKPTSNKAEIRRAYIKKVKEYHPDVSRIKNAEEIMKNLNYAYSELIKNNDLDHVHNMHYASIGNKFLEIYVRQRREDFELLVSMARSAKSRSEFYASAMRFAEWEPSFKHAEEELLGKLSYYIKKAERLNSKAKSLSNSGISEGRKSLLEESISEASEAISEAKYFYDSAHAEIEGIKEKIAVLESKQKENLFNLIS